MTIETEPNRPSAWERKTNPNLTPRRKDGYVKWISSMAQPTPEWMVKTVRANLEGTTEARVDWIPAGAACMSMCSPVLSGVSLESVPEMSVEEVHGRLEGADPPLLLDLREPEEYTGPLGHMPGSVLVPLGELQGRLGELEPHRHRSIITICRSGNRSLFAAAILLEAGLAGVRSMAGGTEAWHQNGYPIER